MAFPTQNSILSGKPMFQKAGQARKPFSTRYGAPVTEILNQRENKTGGYDQNGLPLQPGTQFFSPGWNTSGVGPGTRGYHGSGTIGSAAGAVGSAGVPTSQRGRAEKYGGFAGDGRGGGFFMPNVVAAETPTWAMSNMLMNNGGLSQSWRYGGMGQAPQPNVSSVTPQPMATPAPTINPNDPWAGVTTFGNRPINPPTTWPEPVNPWDGRTTFGPTAMNSSNWFNNLIS
jgi:hypothetical protein